MDREAALEDAKRRVETEMSLPANADDQLARDLVVLMRELGRVTAENRRLRDVLEEARIEFMGWHDAMSILAKVDAAIRARIAPEG